MKIFKISFFAMNFIILGGISANATMPLLTPSPKKPDQSSCIKWALQQDDDAIHMWGTQENGKSSTDIAIKRLTDFCLGKPQPEIVGFYSGIGAATLYCEKHRNHKICDGIKKENKEKKENIKIVTGILKGIDCGESAGFSIRNNKEIYSGICFEKWCESLCGENSRGKINSIIGKYITAKFRKSYIEEDVQATEIFDIKIKY